VKETCLPLLIASSSTSIVRNSYLFDSMFSGRLGHLWHIGAASTRSRGNQKGGQGEKILSKARGMDIY
jgi:hypothetical protein